MADTPPDAATELAPSASETAAVTAWSLDDGEEWQPPRRWSPTLVTAAAVIASLALVAVASVIAWQHLRASNPDVAASNIDASMVPAAVTPVTTTTSPVAAPPKPPPAPPPVTVTTVVQAPPTTLAEMSPEHPGISAQQMAAYDQRLLASLRARGWAVWDPGLTIARAHQVCALLYNGESVAQVRNRLVAEAANDGGDVYATANGFMDSTMATYPDCP